MDISVSDTLIRHKNLVGVSFFSVFLSEKLYNKFTKSVEYPLSINRKVE